VKQVETVIQVTIQALPDEYTWWKVDNTTDTGKVKSKANMEIYSADSRLFIGHLSILQYIATTSITT
jgi:hypothetical protein